jgi:hydroxylamine reductase (hybrid-cluster protein)
MRDGVHWGTTIRWSERGEERVMKIMGGISREQLLGVVGAVFDQRSGGTIKTHADTPR